MDKQEDGLRHRNCVVEAIEKHDKPTKEKSSSQYPPPKWTIFIVTIYYNILTVDSGLKQTQIFVGCMSMVTNVYLMKTDKRFVNTLKDNIREGGAMNKLVSGSVELKSAKMSFISSAPSALNIGKVKLFVNIKTHKNRCNTAKATTNTVLYRSGAPPFTWHLCTRYGCFVSNNTFSQCTNMVPLQHSRGSSNNISHLLCFNFWEEVYYWHDASSFHSKTSEGYDHFVGMAENGCHTMTYKMFTSDTRIIICRSSVRHKTSSYPNLHALRGV